MQLRESKKLLMLLSLKKKLKMLNKNLKRLKSFWLPRPLKLKKLELRLTLKWPPLKLPVPKQKQSL